MGWRTHRDGITVVGDIGDPIAIRRRVTFAAPDEGDPPDFSDHEWLAQMRPSQQPNAALTATLELLSDESGPGLIELVVGLDDTTVMEPNRDYYIGIRAVGGAYAGFTALTALLVRGELPVARVGEGGD